MIPLVFEAPTGAAGKAMLQLIKSIHNHHRAYVLPFDDRHETAVFQKNWTHRISTSIQLGTANMIHNIPLGNRAYARISKEQYGERLQDEEKTKHTEDETESEDGDQETEANDNEERDEEIEKECTKKIDDSLSTMPTPAFSRIIGQNVGGGV